MANLDSPFGFMPIQPILHRQEYRVNQANTYRIGLNDLVIKEAAGTVIQALAGNTNVSCGSVESIVDAQGVPKSYVPATCGEAYKVVVADDPDQLFVAQDDGDTTQFSLNDEGSAVLIIIGNCNIATGLSIMELDSSSTGASASNGQIRLMRFWPRLDNAIGANAKWVCKIHNHQNGPGVLGVAV